MARSLIDEQVEFLEQAAARARHPVKAHRRAERAELMRVVARLRNTVEIARLNERPLYIEDVIEDLTTLFKLDRDPLVLGRRTMMGCAAVAKWDGLTAEEWLAEPRTRNMARAHGVEHEIEQIAACAFRPAKR